jgi:hypothetical protein
MKQSSIHDAAHWRVRAEEARRSADAADDPEAKKTLTEIADAYERLAELLAKPAT